MSLLTSTHRFIASGPLDSAIGRGKLGATRAPQGRASLVCGTVGHSNRVSVWSNLIVIIMSTQQSQSFRVERHGDIAVVIPASEVESMEESLIHQAAEIVLAPLRKEPPGGLVVDLSEVKYFGSVFISFLLRCHLLVKKHGSELVLAGASDRARELLHLMQLDTLWALYSTRAEAMDALGGYD